VPHTTHTPQKKATFHFFIAEFSSKYSDGVTRSEFAPCYFVRRTSRTSVRYRALFGTVARGLDVGAQTKSHSVVEYGAGKP
jgi:hypothetical protein